MQFKPFANDADVLTVKNNAGEFSIENGADVVVISGELDVTRDKRGLEAVRSVLSVLQAVEQALAADANLPDTQDIPVTPSQTVKNPF